MASSSSNHTRATPHIFTNANTVNRACQACNRKKMKCDMTRPVCKTCIRVGSECTYPLRQKRRSKVSKSSPPTHNGNSTTGSFIDGDFAKFDSQQALEGLLDLVSIPSFGLSTYQEDFSLSGTENPLSTEPGLFPDNGVGDSLSWNMDDDAWVSVETNVDPLSIEYNYDVKHNGWLYSDDVMGDLIELFFTHVQSWVPFMRKSDFEERFMRQATGHRTLVDRATISEDEAFTIYGMTAIAARFSNSPQFHDLPAVCRGDALALHATTLKDSLLRDLQHPTLSMIKGCILLAFYNLLAAQFGAGSILTSTCVRLAYQLSLDEIDEDEVEDDGGLVPIIVDEDPTSWVQKEELRRVWWSIWELDTFVSAVSLQPFNIARGPMKVLLPVPDFNWICGIPMKSAFIKTQPEHIWTTLKESPNRSARAWFILVLYIQSIMMEDIRRPSKRPRYTNGVIDTALCSFKLSLPPAFNLGSLFLDRENHEEGCWVISTHLMIIVCEYIVIRSQIDQEDASTAYQALMSNMSQFAERSTSYLSKISQAWSPEYSPLGNPIICCTLIIIGSAGVQCPDSTRHSRDIARILLGHYAKYWCLGSAMLQLLTILEQWGAQPIEPRMANCHEVILKQFSAFLPSMSRRKGKQAVVTHDTPRAGCLG